MSSWNIWSVERNTNAMSLPRWWKQVGYVRRVLEDNHTHRKNYKRLPSLQRQSPTPGTQLSQRYTAVFQPQTHPQMGTFCSRYICHASSLFTCFHLPFPLKIIPSDERILRCKEHPRYTWMNIKGFIHFLKLSTKWDVSVPMPSFLRSSWELWCWVKKGCVLSFWHQGRKEGIR